MSQIGYIGLGKMGKNMSMRLKDKGWDVYGYNRSKGMYDEVEKYGIKTSESIEGFIDELSGRKIVWLMLPNLAVQDVFEQVIGLLSTDDVLIDGGNSNYKDTLERSKMAEAKGVHFLDVGVSGGPSGAREGACVMVGGESEVFYDVEDLFKDISAPEAYGYMGKSGCGHFVKMVHNGIEYGMMQAIAEGFNLMKESEFDLDLEEVSRVYNHKSVIESRLVGWLQSAYDKYSVELDGISGEVSHSGEGLWTTEAAKDLGVPVEIIEKSLKFRENTQGNPSYTGKVVSALRHEFGGHDVREKE